MEWNAERFVFRAFWAAVVLLFLIAGGCSVRKNELIAGSADPVATACALGANEAACLLVAERD